VVLTSVLLLTLFVFAFAFPKVAKILTEMKIPLPFSTQILITFSTFLTTYWYLALAGLAGVILGLRWVLRNPVNLTAVDRLKLRIPLFGNLVRQIAVSRFAHHLALLLEAGIGIFDALVATERVVGNRIFSEAIRDVREQVEGGMTLTDALRRSGEFPPMTIRMVQVGESSATLVESLNRVADYYDKEVPNTVKKVFAAAEPMLIVMLAVVVAFVALSIYLPIYRSIGMIGK
jgi:type II secretory pathway component PulF